MFECVDPEGEWLRSERELLAAAVEWETAYRNDPAHVYHGLVERYGKEDANRVVRWMDSLKSNTALQDFDPKEAA